MVLFLANKLSEWFMKNVELIPFTKESYAQVQKELEHLKSVERPKIIQAIADARAHGDLKENGEYHAAREKQGLIEARITDLEDKFSRAQVIEISHMQVDTIRFGAWVSLLDEESDEEKKYRIVGELEADITKNLISVSSPLAKALLGKRVNDLVEITVPKGSKEYTVLKIEY
jgi:transcription elongation factor GreA